MQNIDTNVSKKRKREEKPSASVACDFCQKKLMSIRNLKNHK